MKPSEILQEPALSSEQIEIVEGVMTLLSTKSRKTRDLINRAYVEEVVRTLALDEQRPLTQAPVLQVTRLRFRGEKHIDGELPEPFEYVQDFAPGVNVICVQDNNVGKSSILKTIKFALSGDDDYDRDIRSWITEVWLTFRLNQQLFTVLHSTRQGHRAALVPQQESSSIDDVIERGAALFEADGREAVQDALQQFFFRRLGLEKRSWTHLDQGATLPVERSISWRTYFLALYIPDDADEYVLVGPKHATGNQGGLILTALLGLSLTAPLNRLGVEATLAKKEVAAVKQAGAASVAAAQEEIAELEQQMEQVRRALEAIAIAQAQRRAALLQGDVAQRLPQMLSQRAAAQHLIHACDEERKAIGRDLRTLNARARRLDEAVALRLHFTGLEVELCPSCDHDVDASAIERERETHTCRLCGKPAQVAQGDEVEELRQEAAAIAGRIEQHEQVRRDLTRDLAAHQETVGRLTEELALLEQVASQSIDDVLPTQEEQAQTETLYTELGQLSAELSGARRRATPQQHQEDALNRAAATRELIREYLRAVSETRNQTRLDELSRLTQDAARNIGAESVSDMSCSVLGQITLKKHGEPVVFSAIRNQGERLRIKLAFFLSLMRLGRQPGAGRHPGFLIIDQPGSGEMVMDDFLALASIFRNLDESGGNELQIITATARPEFAAATVPEKVYGPTPAGRAF